MYCVAFLGSVFEERFACEGWVMGVGKLYLPTYYGSESVVGSHKIW